MGADTKIEWTDDTWNPIVGCSVVSPGCTNCYAMRLAGTPMKSHPTRIGLTQPTRAGPVWNGKVRFNARELMTPLRRRKPRMVFVCAHSDLFHEAVPDAWIDRVFAVMALCPQHVFQVLTKRPERMRDYLSDAAAIGRVYELVCDMAVEDRLPVVLIHPAFDASAAPSGPRIHLHRWPLPNVWLGVSVEDQRRADERIPVLLDTPAAIRWVSAEPLLGPLQLDDFSDGHKFIDALRGNWWHDVPDEQRGNISRGHEKIGWVVAGGESGPNARPMHPAWVRSLRDQCAGAGVPFLFKQWGEWAPVSHMSDEAVDACYAPAPPTNPEATRRELVSNTVLHVDGSQHDPSARNAFVQGTRAMTMFSIGKKRAGRVLDGVIHDAFPEPRR